MIVRNTLKTIFVILSIASFCISGRYLYILYFPGIHINTKISIEGKKHNQKKLTSAEQEENSNIFDQEIEETEPNNDTNNNSSEKSVQQNQCDEKPSEGTNATTPAPISKEEVISIIKELLEKQPKNSHVTNKSLK